MYTPSIGSISSGTLDTADLLDAFAAELEYIVVRNADAWCSDAGRAQRDGYMALIGDAQEVDCDEDPERADELLDELQSALDLFAPDYAYFGAHPGDGAEFGYWLMDDWQSAMNGDGVVIVEDSSEIPEGYAGLACVINDHGNATLLAIDAAGDSRELWSVV